MSKFEEIMKNHKLDPNVKHWHVGPKITDQEVQDFWAQANERGRSVLTGDAKTPDFVGKNLNQ